MKTIVIDPGHGGKDCGAIGFGKFEKDLNLRFALRLEDALKNRYEIIMTRTTDVFVSLADRAKTEPNALFVSIHHNSVMNGVASGIEVFYRGDKERVGSKLLATRLSEEISLAGNLPNRGAKNGKFRVLSRPSTAVLLELGFMSNPIELEKITSEKYIKSAIDAILKVLP